MMNKKGIELAFSQIIWWIILGLFIILILIVSIFPFYSIRIDPEPKTIPGKDVIIPNNIVLNPSKYKINSTKDLISRIDISDPVIKQTADKIVSIACNRDKICHAKALYYFIRNNYQYISDPIDTEYLEEPRDFLSVGGGDCESGATALASLLLSVGIETELVLVPKHAYIRIKIDDAPNKYKKNGWIYLDWTCESCKFGEIPIKTNEGYEKYLAINT